MKKYYKIKKNLADILELPKDIILDIPRITMIGNMQLSIENHKGIVEYSNSTIKINTNSGTLRIKGKNLLLKNIVLEEAVIIGDFELIEFDV